MHTCIWCKQKYFKLFRYTINELYQDVISYMNNSRNFLNGRHLIQLIIYEGKYIKWIYSKLSHILLVREQILPFSRQKQFLPNCSPKLYRRYSNFRKKLINVDVSPFRIQIIWGKIAGHTVKSEEDSHAGNHLLFMDLK